MRNSKLQNILQLSKAETATSQAAANSITILVRAGVRFNGADLRRIQIPNADLSEGQFDSAQFQGANLTNVSLRRTWLRQADLRGATMTAVRLGEKPYFDAPRCCSAAISSDAKMVIVGHYNGYVQIYDASDFSPQFTFKGHPSRVNSVTFSKDCSLIASGGADRTVHTWHLKERKDSVFQGHSDWVCSIAFAPDSRQVAAASRGSVRVWNVESRSCVHILNLTEAFEPVVAWSPCGRQLATGSGALMLWDAETGKHERTLNAEGVRSVVYSCKGKLLAVGFSAKLFVWDLASDKEGNNPIIMNGTGEFESAAFSQDEQIIATTCFDGSLQLWNGISGSYITNLNGHTNTVHGVAFLKDQELMSVSDDNTIRFWQLSVIWT